MRVYQLGKMQGQVLTSSVVCLGVFDGVHIGHKALIDRAMDIAQQEGLTAVVHTYDRLPGTLISPHQRHIELTPFADKIDLLQALGIRHVAISTFDESLQHMRGVDFFNKVLRMQLKSKHLVAGFNHRFGYRGDTDVSSLKKLCEQSGISLSVIPPVRTAQGHLVSSSAVRTALLQGDEVLAGEMLGRPVDQTLRSRVAPYLVIDANRHTTEV
ncbi:MAG TPA: FAD synthetase family protein [Clostridia bacterium]|nr:FAD synthetase family protein [Clostridia bacterium]